MSRDYDWYKLPKAHIVVKYDLFPYFLAQECRDTGERYEPAPGSGWDHGSSSILAVLLHESHYHRVDSEIERICTNRRVDLEMHDRIAEATLFREVESYQ